MIVYDLGVTVICPRSGQSNCADTQLSTPPCGEVSRQGDAFRGWLWFATNERLLGGKPLPMLQLIFACFTLQKPMQKTFSDNLTHALVFASI